ncbi:MAG: glutamine amidotransferase, partial [Anaerolineales bacterium]
AKEAAMRAIEILRPNDRAGVIGFSDSYWWPVRLGTVGQGLDLREVLDRVSAMTARGNTNMLSPLEAGVRELAEQPTERKHIVLLSDGQTYRGTAADFEALAVEARQSGITISTIALGKRGEPGQGLMAAIADWGRGRYHLAEDPADIPRLMLAESQSVNSDPLQGGRTQFQVHPHPLVRDFSPDDFPPVEGYLALSPRPEADVALTSGSFGDPILAAWQYGLGRVVAWTSDAGGDWAPAWRTWNGFSRFWTQVVRYALPDPSQGPLFVGTNVSANQVSVTVLAAGDDGKGINLADGHLLFRGPDDAIARVELPQTAPGEYATTFAVPGPGAYRAIAVLEKDEQRWEASAGFVVGYPAEFSPRVPNGIELLTKIAQVTGGRVASDVSEIRPPRAVTSSTTGYAPWLIAAALLLWVADIAVRRRWMPWP